MMEETGLLRLALRRELARESDRFYRQAEDMGRDLALAKLEKAQIHSLETIAYSTDKLSDIWDFVKKQVGRHGQWRHDSVGVRLLSDLRSLDAVASQVVRRLKEQGRSVTPDTTRQVHLALCREYVRHIAAQFEYGGERGERGDRRAASD